MDSALIDEAQTAAAAARGDTAAFGLLVERHQEVAFRAAYLILRDAAEAEDAAQEGFIRAYRRMDTFRTTEPFRPWLLRIVSNVALNAVRSRGRREGLLARAGRLAPTSEAPPHDDLAARDQASALLQAIAELPEDDRTVLHLRYFLELPEREIAVAIGKRAGTVKSRLSRASGRLRALIETKYPQLMEHIDG